MRFLGQRACRLGHVKLASLTSRDRWERWLAVRHKRLAGLLRPQCESRPVFVLGKQRSGTTMLMHAFHRHPDLLVYDEHRDSAAFDNFRLRSLGEIEALLDRVRFPVVCFKPICDSHLIRSLRTRFPDGHCIWMYRDYRDVANSSIRKFYTATGAVRRLCNGLRAEGWFQEGVSPVVTRTLQRVNDPNFSEFDFACLTWWVRNQIVIRSGLIGDAWVTLLKYEELVTQPVPMLRWLFDRAGIEYRDRIARNITPRFIRRNPAPEVNPKVQRLCDATLQTLDEGFRAADPPVERLWRADRAGRHMTKPRSAQTSF